MCGITCLISNSESEIDKLSDLLELYKDNISKRGPDLMQTCSQISNSFKLIFAASILWLQGQTLTRQPINKDRSIFVYNGDIFGGIPKESRKSTGDTKLFLDLLENSKEISVPLSKLKGPYAFVYFDKLNRRLFFGRDIFGRRSLLLGKRNKTVILSSVVKRSIGCDFIEVPSIGTFCLNLDTNELIVHPWQFKNENFNFKLKEFQSFLKLNITLKQELATVENVTYSHPTNDHLSFINSLKGKTIEDSFQTLLGNQIWFDRVVKLKQLLRIAIETRVAQPAYCKNCININKMTDCCKHSLTGVLFSGGVDCAILSLLLDEFVDRNRPIDLINVAFNEENCFKSPDRLTGLETWCELKALRPNRKWNFLEINVTKDVLDEERTKHVADLIYPLGSVLDDSLGCALWFAARAKSDVYISPCRVLLVGMGADELFGGYTRHRAALKRNSWLGLHNVLNEDWQNLSFRNLGRDDRVVSDNGRQLRTPYLDEDVVQFLRELQSWERTCPSEQLTQGFGEKLLLRSLAFHLGLHKAACLKKRALQFGSRIANKKENAHDISTRLLL